MNIHLVSCVAIVGLVVSGSFSAMADDALPSYKSLVKGGYEVKSVTLVPKDQVNEVAGVAYAEVIVTLQKADLTAVCLFATGNWLIMNPPSLDGTVECHTY